MRRAGLPAGPLLTDGCGIASALVFTAADLERLHGDERADRG
jgi:hypothetical protein